MKALTAAEMREVDRLTTERCGIPSLQLMDNAGKSVFDFLRSAYGDVATSHAAVLCGKGNNGGDGFVVARLLQETGLKPGVYLFAEAGTLRGDAAENFSRLRNSGAAIQTISGPADWETARGEVAKSHVIVDALLGTGLKGKVEGTLASVIEDLNKISRCATSICPQSILAVDTPSGLPSDGGDPQGSVVRAHATVTFTAPKIGQLVSKEAACCGIPLVRRIDSHKGSYGHVLLVAGSLGKSGAAILAGRGALRAGAGLVTIATPDSVLPIVASGQPEIMTVPLISSKLGSISASNLKGHRFRELWKGKTLLAVGPGLGTNKETQKYVTSIVQQSDLPVILDADGLNAFAGRASVLAKRKTRYLAITPHPGEMGRLCGTSNEKVQADRLGVALKAAAAWKAHVILKGFHTILACPDGRAFVNTTGNPGMAKGGSGDVLTGILAGMASQFGVAHWERSLALGVYLHGRAGDEASAEREEASLLAGEIAEAFPDTYRRFIKELRQSA